MKLIHIAGIPRSGKTTLYLNCLKQYDVLWSEKIITHVNDVLFVGPGMSHIKYKRKVGADLISQDNFELMDRCDSLGRWAFVNKGHINKKTLLIESVNPCFERSFWESWGFEYKIYFCWVYAEQFEQRSRSLWSKVKKSTNYYMRAQQDLWDEFAERYGDENMVRWIEPNISLNEKVNVLLQELGFTGNRISDAIVDFKSHWQEHHSYQCI